MYEFLRKPLSGPAPVPAERPQPRPRRSILESRYGHDFTNVRVLDPIEESVSFGALGMTSGHMFTTPTGLPRQPLPDPAQASGPEPAAAPEPAPDPDPKVPPPAAAKPPKRPPVLSTLDITLTPMNMQWPKGAQFYNPSFSLGPPLQLWKGLKPKWDRLTLDLGPTIGVDLNFGESDTLRRTAGLTGATISGTVEVGITATFSDHHKVSFSLGGGGGFSIPRGGSPVSGSAGGQVALQYTADPGYGVQFFGGIRVGVGASHVLGEPWTAASLSYGFFAGYRFGISIKRK